MELWVAGIALLIIAMGILVLILCREKIHKGLRIAVVCVLGVLFVAVLGYIALTFLFLNSLDSPPLDVSTASGKVLSEKPSLSRSPPLWERTHTPYCLRFPPNRGYG